MINGSCKHRSVHCIRLLSSSNNVSRNSDVVKAAEKATTQALGVKLELAQLRSELTDNAYIIVSEILRKQKYLGGCSRDMRGCPRGWADSTGGCIPPQDYNGLCGRIDFNKFTFSMKEDVTVQCRLNWPCSSKLTDFASTCPQGWTQIDAGLCLAPEGYAGICSPATDFSKFDRNQKAKWSAFCNVAWPH